MQSNCLKKKVQGFSEMKMVFSPKRIPTSSMNQNIEKLTRELR